MFTAKVNITTWITNIFRDFIRVFCVVIYCQYHPIHSDNTKSKGINTANDMHCWVIAVLNVFIMQCNMSEYAFISCFFLSLSLHECLSNRITTAIRLYTNLTVQHCYHSIIWAILFISPCQWPMYHVLRRTEAHIIPKLVLGLLQKRFTTPLFICKKIL